MISIIDGTVFNVPTDAKVNTINTVGAMGAGIALEYKLRYPEMYNDYKLKCDNNELHVGEVDYYETDELTIINFPTKAHFKYPSNIKWIEAGLQNFVSTYKEHNIRTVAFPKLATLNGGLNWDDVLVLMKKYLGPLPITVYICLDTLPFAEGREAEMVKDFNNTDTNTLASYVHLSTKQKCTLEDIKPLNRFWKLSKLPGIGEKTYDSLFKLFYNNSIDTTAASQLSLF